MGDSLLLDSALAPALEAAGIRSAGDLLALGGDGTERSFAGFVDLSVAGTTGRFHVKRYRYANAWRARGLLGRGTLWGVAPEVNEYRALAWLRAHDIPAVRPVAAASRRHRGALRAHALLTEAVPDAEDLDRRLHTPGDPLRASARLRDQLVRALGSVLGRMHALGFTHRDCHARNILVRVAGADLSLWLLDCRRGGVGGWRRGPLFDLACLDRDLKGVLTRTERRRALRAWLGAGRDAKAVVRRVARLREGLPPPRGGR